MHDKRLPEIGCMLGGEEAGYAVKRATSGNGPSQSVSRRFAKTCFGLGTHLSAKKVSRDENRTSETHEGREATDKIRFHTHVHQ